jgi:PAS domain S-box-containing protein
MRGEERSGMKIDFGGVVDALPGLVWTTQADGRSDFVNRGWHEYTGLGLDEAIDHGWQRAIHPDDLTTFVQSWDLIRQSGVGKEINARLQRSDGEYRWFVLHPSPLPQDDSHDRRWCWLGSFADEGPTTDERLRRLWDMLPFRSGFLDSAGLLEWGNLEARQKTHNVPLKDLQEWKRSRVMLLDDHAKNEEMLAALFTTGKMYENEVRMRHSDGAYRWARARAVPIRDAQGNAVRYLSCQFDIHDLKQAEALLAAEVKLLEMVARGEPLREVLDALSRHVEELSSGCFCSILVIAPDERHFEVGAGPSMPDAYNAIFEERTIDGGYSPYSLAVLEKTRVITADLLNDPRWASSIWPAQMKTFGYASCWSMPIMSVSGEASGVFAVYRCDPVGPTPHEQDLIDRFTKIAGIAIDRAQADAALQTSERELREALAQLTEGQRLSKTGSFTSDVQQDRHRWSDEFYRILEIDRTTPARFEAVRDRVHPDDLQLFNAEIQSRLDGRGASFNFRIVTPNGGLKHLRGVSQIIEHIGGRPIFMGSIQDITESKVAEMALTTSEAGLRRANSYLTEAQRLSKTGSFTWDVYADEHNWSEEIHRTFGFEPNAKVTMGMIQAAVHPEDMAEVERVLGGAAEGRDFDLIFRILTRDREVRHAHVVGHRIEHITDRPVFLGALQDVTESKVAEEELNRVRSELAHVARVATLNAMTASIAHEVNQPLSGILTNANTCVRMLAANPPNLVGAAETVRRTIRDANRATEVIQRLRAMFSTKAPTMEKADLNDVAREVIALSMGELRRKEALLQTDFADELPHVSVDRVQLQQVILNLMLNAADAMAGVEDRTRTMLVQTGLHSDGSVKLLVRDSGTGVDPNTVERLFDAFYTTKAQGMGVGLSISRSIIERHDGRLWAEANEGPGATFSFCIPSA